MKITPVPATPALRTLMVPTSAGGEPATPVGRVSELHLSDAARAPNAAVQQPATQTHLLQELKEAVAEGRYQVDADLVAERLLQWQL